jgi:O6-methylguanine-DNA--protein-cysteine methyltransferase
MTPSSPTPDTTRFYRAVYAIVACVPFGKVTTYGDIALALGWPRHARLVGYAPWPSAPPAWTSPRTVW